MLPTRSDRLRALYRIAKDRKRGLLPFFRNPHAMIALRNRVAAINELEPKKDTKQ